MRHSRAPKGQTSVLVWSDKSRIVRRCLQRILNNLEKELVWKGSVLRIIEHTIWFKEQSSIKHCYRCYHPWWQRNHQNQTTMGSFDVVNMTQNQLRSPHPIAKETTIEPQISKGSNGSTKFEYIKLPNWGGFVHTHFCQATGNFFKREKYGKIKKMDQSVAVHTPSTSMATSTLQWVCWSPCRRWRKCRWRPKAKCHRTLLWQTGRMDGLKGIKIAENPWLEDFLWKRFKETVIVVSDHGFPKKKLLSMGIPGS